ACRHTGGSAFALTPEMGVMNDQARGTIDPRAPAAPLSPPPPARAGARPPPLVVRPATRARRPMPCRPLQGKGKRRVVGGVVSVKLTGPASQPAVNVGTGLQARRFGPALVGSGPLWLRGCRQVEAARASGEWLSLEGEPGTGKLALLRAIHRRRNPAGALHVLDAADAGDPDWMKQ